MRREKRQRRSLQRGRNNLKSSRTASTLAAPARPANISTNWRSISSSEINDRGLHGTAQENKFSRRHAQAGQEPAARALRPAAPIHTGDRFQDRGTPRLEQL